MRPTLAPTAGAPPLGRRAVELAMAQLGGQPGDQELIAPQLSVRGSDAPPDRGPGAR